MVAPSKKRTRCEECAGLGFVEDLPSDYWPCPRCHGAQRYIDEDGKVALNIRNMPLGLRRRFKLWCMERETNMSDVLVQLMKNVLDGKVEIGV